MPDPNMTSRMTQARAARAEGLAKSDTELLQNARLDVDTATETSILNRLASMPKSFRRTYLKAMKGRAPVVAIKAHCMECVGWVRDEVTKCTAPACPLYPYRPYREDDV